MNEGVVWRSRDKAGYEWPWPVTVKQLDVRLLQVRAWHDRSYIAGIPMLAHSLSVKLSPCPYSHSIDTIYGHSSPAGQIAACLWTFQMQFTTHSGLPQDDSASFYIVVIYFFTYSFCCTVDIQIILEVQVEDWRNLALWSLPMVLNEAMQTVTVKVILFLTSKAPKVSHR